MHDLYEQNPLFEARVKTRPHPTRRNSKQYYLYLGGIYNGWYTLKELYSLPERHPSLSTDTIASRVKMANLRKEALCKNLYECITMPLDRESNIRNPFNQKVEDIEPDLTISKLWPAGSLSHKVK